MEEEATSWIRRTKFSHTICHRLDSSRLASIHLSLPERNSGLKSRVSKQQRFMRENALKISRSMRTGTPPA
ncbi:hypothetical protein ACOSQ4_004155 [Xanthoceras sorbifolium]